MNYQEKNFRKKVAAGITFKKLRVKIIIGNKPMSQQYLNNDIYEKYNKTWNSAREESLPNTTLENLILICDYFTIKTDDFFKLVNMVSQQEIDDAIGGKRKLQLLYQKLKQS